MTAPTLQEVTSTTTVLLPHVSSSVASARRRLCDDLRSHGMGGTFVDDAALVLSEILSNALRHARPLASGKIQVDWRLHGDAVEITVTDGGGPTHPTPTLPSVSSLGGRGLGIVMALAADWGVREAPTGTTVWALVALRGGRRTPRG